MMIRIFCALCLASLGIAPGQDGGIAQTALWESGANGYHTYRIPALAVTAKGTVLAFCEGRRAGRGDAGDIAVLANGTALCLYERGESNPYESIALARFKLTDLR